jgi:hypothetical protein
MLSCRLPGGQAYLNPPRACSETTSPRVDPWQFLWGCSVRACALLALCANGTEYTRTGARSP